MSTPLIVTHPCALLHDGLLQIFSKSRFRPVRIAPTLDERMEAYLRSSNSSIWLIGVERWASTTKELLQRVVTTTPGVKPVILAAYQRPDDIMAALEGGAHGFLCQDRSPERLVKSLELIALGEIVVPHFSWAQMTVGPIRAKGELADNSALQANGVESHLFRHSDSRLSHGVPTDSEREASDVTRGLSRREKLILRMLVEGASNKDIALKLVITDSTVKVHMKTILRKLRLQNRTQAALWASDHLSELKSE
jgi:two-component system, NarL family, nitrate/nitrite response regulator NarL